MSGKPLKFLPYSRQLVEDDDISAVAEVLRSDFLTTGPAVQSFETAFAARVGARYALSCSNGTSALHLAALSLDLGPGEAVIVPTLTFLATANAARFVNAEVVFADVDPSTGLVTEESLEEALARARNEGLVPKAIFPVHLNGQCVDMESVARIARREGLAVVEDACHALGGFYLAGSGDEPHPLGSCSHSDLGVFSLHPVKTIAMGEGGMVTTGDEKLHERVLRFRNHGMVRDASSFVLTELAFDDAGGVNPWHYEMPAPGYNYRASDIHCALGLSQLGKLDRFVAARQRLVALYDKALAPLAPVVKPIGRVNWCQPAWHLYVVQIDYATAGISRRELVTRLRQKEIGTQVHYLPVHMQPYYRDRYGAQSLPGAEAYYRQALSLPLFPAMTAPDIERVTQALEALCAH